MKPDLSRYVPLGIPWRDFLGGYLAYLFCAVIFSFGFLIRYINALDSLYYYVDSGKKVLRPANFMPEFYELIGRFFTLFYLLIPFLILVAFFFYLSHYRGTKSIYLMKRLPKKNELYIRCLTLPLLGIVIGLILGFLLLLVYYLIYMNATPTQCIPPDQWQKLWSVIL